jgi:hypothetical protein
MTGGVVSIRCDYRTTAPFVRRWNANSGDTKGIVGPRTTWREVQWLKVRLLIRNYGLRPWYCGWWPDFCDTVEW